MNKKEIKEYPSGVVVETITSDNIVEVPKTLTLEEINSKLDDITLLMLQQGGIIA